MNYSKLSYYQEPKGTLREKKHWEPRVLDRIPMIYWDDVLDKTVLDIGCNNGDFVRAAIKAGAKRAVGVDNSACIEGARILAEEEGVDAEFWQVDVESPEFMRFCPRFDVVFLFSVLTHLKDKDKFLDWLDYRIKHILYFESNHGEVHKNQIDLVRKYVYFDFVKGPWKSDIPEKPHYMWMGQKSYHESKYPSIGDKEVEWIPLDKIYGIDEENIMNQDTSYSVTSDKFKKLKEDIKKRGIRSPIFVQWGRGKGTGKLWMFQGGHRYLAAKQLGLPNIPCKVLRTK